MEVVRMPFYAKAAFIFICLFSTVFILCIGQLIIVPIVYATLIAILLNPIVNYLTGKNLNRILAISIAVVFAILVVLGFLAVISSQINMFSDAYPQLKVKFETTSNEIANWISEKFNIGPSKISVWARQTQREAINNFKIGEKLNQVGQIMMVAALLPVYLFMILYYKTLLLEFIARLFPAEHHKTVGEVLSNTKKIIQSYLVGLFVEMIIIAVLNSGALLLIGVDYAIILGITGAILNVIPYIGGIIAIALPMIIAFVTEDSLTSPAIVFFAYILIQFVDNHYIVPKIVASRVKINALVSVIVVLVGNAIWGVPGMFLSIPVTAILKVIFDHIEPLMPW
ncbi:MAG: AI-2E family transporter, partial [Bacteroidia bacterium]